MGNWFSKTGNNLLKSQFVLYLLVLLIVFNLYNYAMIGHEVYAVCLILIGFLTSFFSKNMIVILFTALAVTNIIRFGMEQFTMEGFVSNGVELDELTNHLTEGSGLDTNKEELKKKEEDLENMEKEKISVEKTIKNMNLENKELNTNPKERDQTIDTLVKTITASNSVQMLERNMNFSQLELGKDKVNLALKSSYHLSKGLSVLLDSKSILGIKPNLSTKVSIHVSNLFCCNRGSPPVIFNNAPLFNSLSKPLFS